MGTELWAAWAAIILYVAATCYLTYRGAKKSNNLSNYSVGNKDIPAFFVGISLCAQLTSVATFVVNPGLIYKYGLSGMLGFGVAAAAGVAVGIITFSRQFLKVGSQTAALTVPQWIGKRYQSRNLQLLFSIISLALVTFAVLIVVALSLTLGQLLGISAQLPDGGGYNLNFTFLIAAIVIFVFSYMMLGGANTHAYTNSIQGLIMLVVGIILIFSGWSLFFEDGGLFARLAAIDPNLVTIVNPESPYFRTIFEVFFCNFIVGIAIVCQPHIVSKVLYLKDESQIKPYLTTAVLAGIVFSLVMITGFYARLAIPVTLENSDMAIPVYINTWFNPIMRIFITIGIICAGLSTLEGILLALSSIFAIDLFLPSLKPRDGETEIERGKRAMKYGKITLGLIAVAVIAMSVWQIISPTGGSVVIFTMYGIYLLFTTTFFPLACGMFLPTVNKFSITAGIIIAIITYLSIPFIEYFSLRNNPAFLATAAIILGWLTIFLFHIFSRSNRKSA